MFGAITFLYFLPLAGLPVVFHLMMRRRRKTMLFPTFLFFLRADPRLNSRRKLREVLLLVLRSLLILFLFLALSRPVLRMIRGFQEQILLAVIVDNSGSMNASAAGGVTRLQVALESARALLEHLPEHSQAALVPLVEDPALHLPTGLTADSKELMAALDRIKPTHASGNAPEALRRALAALHEGEAHASAPMAIHVFSDCQEVEWAHGQTNMGEAARTTDFVFHRIRGEGAAGPNVAIDSISTPVERALPNHPVHATVVLRNLSQQKADVRCNSLDSLKRSDTRPLSIPANGVETVRLTLTPTEPGTQWISVWVEGDSFSADNSAGIGFSCQAKATVLLCGGRQDFALLPKAISPEGDGRFTFLVPKVCEPGSLAARMKSDAPVLVIVTWQVLQELGDAVLLREFVEKGGGLLVVPAAGATKPPASVPAWLGARPRELQALAKLGVIDVLDRQSALWGVLRDEKGSVQIRQLSARKYFPLELSKEFTPLLGPSFRKPVLASTERKAGAIYVSGVPFDPAWTALPTDPSGMAVVLLHHMAARGASGGDRTVELVAGEQAPPIAADASEVQAVSLVGDALQLTLPAGHMPAFPRAGVFTVTCGAHKQVIWVRASPREGEHAFVTGDRIPLMGTLAHTVADLEKQEDFAAQLKAHRSGLQLFLPFLLLAVACWMAEGWLATVAGGRTRTAQEEAARAADPEGVPVPERGAA